MPARAGVAEECEAEGAASRRARSRSAVEEPDQLVTLAFAQSADRLRRRDPALGEAARRLGWADLRQCQQEVIDLRCLCRLRWPGDDPLDLHPAQGEFLLQPCPAASDLVRVLQRTHALIERSPGSRIARLARHGRILRDLSSADLLRAASAMLARAGRPPRFSAAPTLQRHLLPGQTRSARLRYNCWQLHSMTSTSPASTGFAQRSVLPIIQVSELRAARSASPASRVRRRAERS
jgi:hypothetical protein